MNRINILALTDIHYIGMADHTCKIEKRKTKQALDLIQKVYQSVDRNQIDLVILLGDLVDNGKAPGADEDLSALNVELKKLGKPIIVVPGNHDSDPQTVFQIFNDYEGLHKVNGYQIITFTDRYAEDDSTERNMTVMRDTFSKADPELPVIVLQHNPVYPHIDSNYPYNVKNAREVMQFYSEQNVILSISGHLHSGMELSSKDSVGYLTCPALCEEPHYYTLITFEGKEYNITRKNILA